MTLIFFPQEGVSVRNIQWLLRHEYSDLLPSCCHTLYWCLFHLVGPLVPSEECQQSTAALWREDQVNMRPRGHEEEALPGFHQFIVGAQSLLKGSVLEIV